MLPWNICAGTLKDYSWNNVFKENIQGFSMGQNTLLVSQVGLPLEFFVHITAPKPRLTNGGNQFRFILPQKKIKNLLTVGEVITFTYHKELFAL